MPSTAPGPPGSRARSIAFASLARWLTRNHRVIGLALVGIAIVSGAYAGSVASRLRSAGLEAPGSEASHVAAVLFDRLGVGQPDVVAIAHAPGGDVRDPRFAARVLDVIDSLLADDGVATVLSYYSSGLDSLVSRDGSSTVLMIGLRGSAAEEITTLERIEPLLRRVDPGIELGGLVPAEEVAQQIAKRDIAKAEWMALPFSLVLLLVFFRGVVAALLPIAVGGFALAVSTALIGGLAAFMEVSVFALTVGSFLGLGLSLDYSLLMVHRFREELARSDDVARAVETTLATAGRAVWLSALTVAVSVAVLVFVPVPLLQGVGIGAVLAVATAAVGALLLLPAVLCWLGPRVDLWPVGRRRDEAGPSPMWLRIAEVSLRRPWRTAGTCTVLLVLIALPGLRMRSVIPDARILPADSAVRRVEEALADPARFDASGIWVIQVLVQAPGPILAPDQLRRVHAFLRELRRITGPDAVNTPLWQLDPARLSAEALRARESKPAVQMALSRTVDRNIAWIAVSAGASWRSSEAVKRVEEIRALSPPGLEVSVGGPTAYQLDVRSTLAEWGLRVAVIVIAWNLLVLLHGFRSVLIPLKAAAMNLLSLAASFGFLVWAFQDAHLAGWLHFEPPGGIDPTIPVVMFAVVFGLSMDYEIFLLSRIQEEFWKHGDNRRSISWGLAYTGRIVSSAGAILIVVIGAFATGFLIYVKEVGVGVAAAIFLDITLVRALLVPATMRLVGDWNWWAPAWLGGASLPAGRSLSARPVDAPHQEG